MNYIKPFAFLLVPFQLILTDIIVRFHIISNFPDDAFQIYILSAVLSILIAKGFEGLLFSLHANKYPKSYTVFLSVISLYYALTLAVTTSYFLSNQLMPNYYTIEFMVNEPENAWTLFRDTTKWYHMIGIGTQTAFVGFLFHTSVVNRSSVLRWKWYFKLLHAGLIITGLNVINNNVRDLDQCFVSDVNNAAHIIRRGYNNLTGRDEVGGTGILARNPVKLTATSENPGFNILIIINESLRWQNMSLYGYDRKTTPFLDSLKKHNNDELFVFKRPWSNASTTVLSVPGIVSGITPAEPSVRLHTVPLFWDYAKSAGYETFFISPQKHNWYNFRLFFSSSAIDYYYTKENSTLESFNDLGINDTVLIELTTSHIRSVIQNGKTFAGVLHLNTTHYPYIAEPRFSKWSGKTVDQYDNTVLKTDYVTGQIMKILDRDNIMKNTIIISTSDHGEAFEEHGYVGHIFCHYIETVSVPIWIYYPKELQSTAFTEALNHNLDINVANQDIMPTVLDLLNLTQSSEVESVKNNWVGESLVRPLNKSRSIVITNTNQIVLGNTGLSLVKGNYHYLFRINSFPVTEELYDFISDPWETSNIWNSMSDSVKSDFRNPFLKEDVTRKLLNDYILKK